MDLLNKIAARGVSLDPLRDRSHLKHQVALRRLAVRQDTSCALEWFKAREITPISQIAIVAEARRQNFDLRPLRASSTLPPCMLDGYFSNFDVEGLPETITSDRHSHPLTLYKSNGTPTCTNCGIFKSGWVR